MLTRVLGKTVDRFVLPSGERRFQSGGFNRLRSPAIAQMQMVQTSRSRMELRVVLLRALTETEEQELRESFTRSLGYPFEIAIVAVDEIPRAASGKFSRSSARTRRDRGAAVGRAGGAACDWHGGADA